MNEKLTRRVTVRLTESEYQAMTARAVADGVEVHEILRTQAVFTGDAMQLIRDFEHRLAGALSDRTRFVEYLRQRGRLAFAKAEQAPKRSAARRTLFAVFEVLSDAADCIAKGRT